ncbi:GDP-fucose synthetase [Sinorhizobium sp. A49]|uniref:GDP-L-fucose synthase family protein n=1 Tax=Sinorhizobium sp. A49 TaxID=1945861 RepID=UPI000986513D|nr:GDP-L-fucose synthase [Sinorhizobium sp. A49]OOG67791.1 GDP-fucose synthetase [Sinorhizobium sp. A49]
MTKILLTGGGGMVGRNLVSLCRNVGIDIVAPGRSELDLLDFNQTQNVLKQLSPDLVIHAAGVVGGIQANIKHPVRFLSDNWAMGNNIVLAARSAGVARLLNLGSSCMYPRNSEDALREDQVLSGTLEPTNEGYALAKCAVARLCEYVTRETPQFDYKTIIPCNLYGPFDKFDPGVSHLIPAIIHKVHVAKLRGETSVEIWGDGSARREFMFAGDLADAIVFAIANFSSMPSLLNIGLGHDFTVNEYYQVAADVVGYDGTFAHDISKPVGMKRKLLDVTKQTMLGWAPRTTLRDGIRKTYEYYLSMEA